MSHVELPLLLLTVLRVNVISRAAGGGASEQAVKQRDQRAVEATVKTQCEGEDVRHL